MFEFMASDLEQVIKDKAKAFTIAGQCGQKVKPQEIHTSVV